MPGTTLAAREGLEPLDWAVIGAYGLLMLAIGWYYSRRTKTTDDYLLGGRRMNPLAVGLSLFASLISTLSYLATPGEMIGKGPIIFAAIASYPAIALVVGWIEIPFIMRLKVTSAYELLETRLGLPARMTGSLLFLLLRLLWMGSIVYATTNVAIMPLLGIDSKEQPWAGPIISVVLCTATMIYTSMGGLRAVVVTDVLQSLILFFGAVVTVIFVSYELGGVGAWWPKTWSPHWQKPVIWFDPAVRMTCAGVFLNSFIWYVCTNGSDQIAIQRYLSTRDAPSARRVLIISLIADVFVTLILAAVGMALFAFYRVHPDVLPAGWTLDADADKFFPSFIVRVLPMGLSGFVVAGLLSAAMCSLSSGLTATTSVVTVDLIDRFRRVAESEQTHVRRAKLISLAIGIVVVFLSLGIGLVKGNLLAVTNKVTNLLVAPLFLLFFMAMFVPFATTWGTLVGVASGIAVAVAIAFFEVFGLSFIWIMPGSLAVGIVVAVVFSLLLPGVAAPMPARDDNADA